MRGRMSVMMAVMLMGVVRAQAQDVPGIEICTVEKTMERRTSCLQSNVNFLQTTLGKQAREQQQKLDHAEKKQRGRDIMFEKAYHAELVPLVRVLPLAGSIAGRWRPP